MPSKGLVGAFPGLRDIWQKTVRGYRMNQDRQFPPCPPSLSAPRASIGHHQPSVGRLPGHQQAAGRAPHGHHRGTGAAKLLIHKGYHRIINPAGTQQHQSDQHQHAPGVSYGASLGAFLRRVCVYAGMPGGCLGECAYLQCSLVGTCFAPTRHPPGATTRARQGP